MARTSRAEQGKGAGPVLCRVREGGRRREEGEGRRKERKGGKEKKRERKWEKGKEKEGREKGKRREGEVCGDPAGGDSDAGRARAAVAAAGRCQA